VSPAESPLSAILNRASAVLFDFDGPLCDVFAGEPSANVARSLERLVGPVDADDPLAVLRVAAQRPGVDVQEVDDQLIAAEVTAIASSIANEDGLATLKLCLRSGRGICIVSNNSEQSIQAFMTEHKLSDADVRVIGRPYGRPDLMKPNSWTLERALSTLNTLSERSAFIGDSLSDIEAAQAAHVPCIALANKPGKQMLFRAAGAVVIDSMLEIAAALGGSP